MADIFSPTNGTNKLECLNQDSEASLLYRDLSYQVMSAVFEVHNILGPGFLEAVYQKALLKELQRREISAEAQKEMIVRYKGESVGSYFSDIVVNNQIILELKTVESLKNIHVAQVMNYLKATGYKLGILINFAAERIEYKRIVL